VAFTGSRKVTALEASGLEGTGFDGYGAAFGDAFAVVFGAAFPSCFLVVLAGLLTAALRVLVTAVLADAVDFALTAFLEAVFPAGALEAVFSDSLEDFLRVFLDIRLPFVAFSGSIIRVLRVVSGRARIKPAAGHI
jgi:hypothetical protein